MEIYKKLDAVKKEIGKISKNSTNPFYDSKYFDINDLLEAAEPLLRKENLLLLQPLERDAVTTRIYDLDSKENDFVQSSIELQPLNDPQKTGSAITYYRRYTLQSLLGLQAEDDDANKAAGKSTDNTTSKKVGNNRPSVDSWMSENQFKQAMSDPSKAKKSLEYYDGKTKQKDGKVYGMKKTYKEQLKSKIK